MGEQAVAVPSIACWGWTRENPMLARWKWQLLRELFAKMSWWLLASSHRMSPGWILQSLSALHPCSSSQVPLRVLQLNNCFFGQVLSASKDFTIWILIKFTRYIKGRQPAVCELDLACGDITSSPLSLGPLWWGGILGAFCGARLYLCHATAERWGAAGSVGQVQEPICFRPKLCHLPLADAGLNNVRFGPETSNPEGSELGGSVAGTPVSEPILDQSHNKGHCVYCVWNRNPGLSLIQGFSWVLTSVPG